MEDNRGAELREHPDANVRCEVCGGRKSACAAIGHRPDRDRGVLWHPDDLAKAPVADRHTEPDARWLGECAIRTLERLGYTYTGGSEWRPPQGKKPAWLDGVLSDEAVDRILNTHIPGGSQARWWFLPHDLPQGLANVRDVVRRMITTYNKVSLQTVVTPAAPNEALPEDLTAEDIRAIRNAFPLGTGYTTNIIRKAFEWGKETALAQPAPVQGPVEWGDPLTVGMFVRQLQTIAPETPIHAAVHTDLDGKRVALTKPVIISRERVSGRRIRQGDESVPYSIVVWSQQDEEKAPVQQDAPALSMVGDAKGSVLACSACKSSGHRAGSPEVPGVCTSCMGTGTQQ